MGRNGPPKRQAGRQREVTMTTPTQRLYQTGEFYRLKLEAAERVIQAVEEHEECGKPFAMVEALAAYREQHPAEDAETEAEKGR